MQKSDYWRQNLAAGAAASEVTFTQTYSTATATVPAITVALTGVDTGTDMTAAQATTIVNDITANRQLINKIIDALQVAGIVT